MVFGTRLVGIAILLIAWLIADVGHASQLGPYRCRLLALC